MLDSVPFRDSLPSRRVLGLHEEICAVPRHLVRRHHEHVCPVVCSASAASRSYAVTQDRIARIRAGSQMKQGRRACGVVAPSLCRGIVAQILDGRKRDPVRLGLRSAMEKVRSRGRRFGTTDRSGTVLTHASTALAKLGVKPGRSPRQERTRAANLSRTTRQPRISCSTCQRRRVFGRKWL